MRSLLFCDLEVPLLISVGRTRRNFSCSPQILCAPGVEFTPNMKHEVSCLDDENVIHPRHRLIVCSWNASNMLGMTGQMFGVFPSPASALQMFMAAALTISMMHKSSQTQISHRVGKTELLPLLTTRSPSRGILNRKNRDASRSACFADAEVTIPASGYPDPCFILFIYIRMAAESSSAHA
jgi:hypothetical protein